MITFPAGTTLSTVVVSTTDDVVAELDEEFSAVLSNPSQGSISSNDMASVFINDNDGTKRCPLSVTTA